MSTVYTIKNQEITIQVSSHGAELQSLKDNRTGTEYMWEADPQYWGRTSPVLFPVVGAYKNNETSYRGKIYSMSQHGFARDMEFVLENQTENSIFFSLRETEETLIHYPFAFRLELGYRIRQRSVEVLWRVENPSTETMYFSIGGHPAFRCPLKSQNGEEAGRQKEYAISFDEKEKLISRVLGKSGVTDQFVEHTLRNGTLPITETLFDNDALIIENDQAHRVSLVRPDGTAYLTVAFEAPLFGIWSPPGKKAPFICIEPWYGRADHEHFTGGLEKREWGNVLAPGEEFAASYTIAV